VFFDRYRVAQLRDRDRLKINGNKLVLAGAAGTAADRVNWLEEDRTERYAHDCRRARPKKFSAVLTAYENCSFYIYQIAFKNEVQNHLL